MAYFRQKAQHLRQLRQITGKKKDLQVIDFNCKSLKYIGRYIQTRTGDLYDVKVRKYYLNYILRFNWRKFGVNEQLSTEE